MCMKDGKAWEKGKERWDMRWERDGSLLALQWKDNKIVTMLSSIHIATQSVAVNRKVKIDDVWRIKEMKQPMVICKYNKFMNAVDKSDQILSTNNVLRKCLRWWKTFFHMIDIAVVNSLIIFQCHRHQNPDDELLKRSVRYATINFREELIKNLAGFQEYGVPDMDMRRPPVVKLSTYETVHIPMFSGEKRNCKVCYTQTKKELKVISYCSAPQCNVYLHCTKEKNCFATWHVKDYPHH